MNFISFGDNIKLKNKANMVVSLEKLTVMLHFAIDQENYKKIGN